MSFHTQSATFSIIRLQAVADRIAGVLDRGVHWASAIFLVLMTIDILVAVFFRYVLGVSFIWSEELARYLMIFTACLTMSSGIKRGEHLTIRFLVEAFPPGLARRIDIFHRIVLSVFLLVLIIYGIDLVWANREFTSLRIIPQRFFSGMDLFPLMAIPFFIMAGEIMNKAMITERLVLFSNSLIGPIIPPSIIMVIYGSLSGASIAALFAGGIIPGIGMGLLLMVMNAYISARQGFPKKERRATAKEVLIAFRRAGWALVAPMIIMGGILGGIFTPTESAAVAVGYCFLAGFFIFKTLKLKHIPEVLFATARICGVTFIVVAFAGVLCWILTAQQVPQMVVKQLMGITQNKYLLLLIINCFLLLVGMFMDVVAALIILTPILAPVATAIGVHPIHFGIIMTVNLCLALVTPPVGGCLFVASGIARISIESLTRQILPFILVALILLALVTYVPSITLAIPRLFGLS